MRTQTRPIPKARRHRRSTTLAGLLTVAAVALAACGGDDDSSDDGAAVTTAATADDSATTQPDGDTATTTAAAPDSDGSLSGTLVVALDRDPGFLDPFHVQNHAGRSIAQAMFDTLVMDIDGEYVPTLAESYTVVDDLTIEFTLREGITFHNGEPFNAAAVEYNVGRMLDPEVDSHYLPQLSTISEVEVIDDLNLVLHLSEPDANIIDTLTYFFMVAPEHAAAVGPDGFDAEPVGTGPYTFVSHAADDRTVVAANPNYWDGSPKGMPLVETVEFRAIPEETTRLAELTAGDVDIAFKLSPDQLDGIESAGATAVTYSDLSIQFIQINTAGVGTVAEAATGTEAAGFEALKDVRVRTALNLAIDREAVVDALFGGFAAPLGQPFAPGGFLTPTGDLAFPYDPEQAKALLAEAGYADGLDLKMLSNTSTGADLTSLVASYFAEIGVNVEIEQLEAATFNDGWTAAQFPHLRYSTWSSPEQVLELLLETGDLISAYSNPDVDALLAEQALQVDPAARKATIEELAQVLHDDAAWVYLWSTDAIVGVSPDVTGWQPAPSYVPVTGVTVGG